MPSGITPSMLGDPDVVLGIKSGMFTCKQSVFATVLSLPQLSFKQGPPGSTTQWVLHMLCHLNYLPGPGKRFLWLNQTAAFTEPIISG